MDSTSLISLLLFIVCNQNTLAISAKSNARPVHEIVNEPIRPDLDKPRLNLPYSNPLAGNQQRARQHALNQQAMFNAERDRQHRAQLQRWTSAPQKMDSYMKAYHESQESHHLALETQLAQQKDAKSKETHAPTASKVVRGKAKEVIRSKHDKSRNHRSYGSDYYAHLSKMNHPRHYEGVTIKPNGINQPSHDAQSSNLYTQSIPSTQFVYPKQYKQMQGYQSAHDIASLSSILMKPANDQLSELNALIQSSKVLEGDNTDIHKPIDLFFYLKDKPSQVVDHENYQYPQYAQAYSNEDEAPKDHTPITEEVNDIADPNQPNKVTPYGIQPVLTPNQEFELRPETTTTKSNNYYKVEVASQTISAGYKPSYSQVSEVKQPIEYVLQDSEEEKPKYQLQYAQQPAHYYTEREPEDVSEKYLHHNAQHKGIHHLTEDGTGVSAYGDNSENLHYAANYEFGYRVRDEHSGNDFGHHEAKSGEKTNGHYHVLLPDGRMQKVKYWAGPSGFHADISYDHLQEEHK